MKIENLILVSVLFVCTLTTYGQSIYPTVQSIKQSEQKIDITNGISIQTSKDADPVALEALKTILSENKKGLKVYIGEVGDKFAKKFNISIPEISGAYYLKTSNDGIVILGHDDRGTFYGVQTLRQLIKDSKIAQVEITDYPEVLFRGSVEGFYGKPWIHSDRLSQLKFYGENKLNTYIYGPKDDPYHSSLSNHADGTNKDSKGSWRDPYPEKEALQIKELTETAKKNKVDFVWAIHPGADIKWNEEDYKILINKLEHMYDLGVRSFAVFFDDINGQGTIEGHRQSALLNRINNEFVKVKGDITPLILCPTEYNKSWADPKPDGYLPILGKNLDPSIQVMWTGDRVCADITMETLNWINQRIMRPTYIWWNFPVTDYVRDRVLLGPSYGLTTQATAKDMVGFTSNPMENAEASKIALFGVSDYTWNPKAYDYLKTWEQALKVIMPNASDAYRTFAIHSADLGQTVHKLRRDESWETNTFNPFKYSQDEFESLKSTFEGIVVASLKIKANNDNPALVCEIKPWIDQFEVLGNRGLKALELIKIYEKGDVTKTWEFILENEMNSDQKTAFNKHKSGILKLRPFIDLVYDTVSVSILKSVDSSVTVRNKVQPRIYTNIDQVANNPVIVSGDTVRIKPMLEVIKIAPKGYIGIELPANGNQIYTMKGVPFGPQSVIEYSVEGEVWGSDQSGARFVRMINNGKKTIEGNLSIFEIGLVNGANSSFDSDLSTGEFISFPKKIAIEKGSKVMTIFSSKGSDLVVSFCNQKGDVVKEAEVGVLFSQIEVPNDANSVVLTGDGEVREIIFSK